MDTSFLDQQQIKQQKDCSYKDYSSDNNFQLVPSTSVSIQIESGKQDDFNFNDQKKKINYQNCLKGLVLGVITGILVAGLTNNYLGVIVGTLICLAISNIDLVYLLQYLINYKNENSLNKNDCEKLIGLNEFKKIIGRDYTKDEFDEKLSRCLLFENPDKQPTEALKQNSLQRQRKFQKAKKFIYKYNGWEE